MYRLYAILLDSTRRKLLGFIIAGSFVNICFSDYIGVGNIIMWKHYEVNLWNTYVDIGDGIHLD